MKCRNVEAKPVFAHPIGGHEAEHKRWTGVVVELSEPYPVSFPALWSAQSDCFEIPGRLPEEVLAVFAPRQVTMVSRDAFVEKARRWPVSPGMKPTCPTIDLTRNWEAWLHDFRTIDVATIRRGREAVQSQSEDWSCGVNSIARMMAMLGHDLPGYSGFLATSPKAFSFFGNWTVGSQPRQLREHLENHIGKLSPRAGENCTDDFETHEQLFERALELGRPSMILFQTSDVNLHWVNLIGRHRHNGNALVMDTDGRILEWQGGREEIWRRMWVTHHAACKFGFISPYNSITCTNS